MANTKEVAKALGAKTTKKSSSKKTQPVEKQTVEVKLESTSKTETTDTLPQATLEKLNEVRVEAHREENKNDLKKALTGDAEYVYKKLLNTQTAFDYILIELLAFVEEKDMFDFPPRTVRVKRGAKSFFCTTNCKFTFAKRTFYVCEHITQDKKVIRYVEDEVVLAANNTLIQKKIFPKKK